jgi:hypothetical protein
MDKKYAPIHLIVYKRLEHTKKTVEALLKNDIAKHSILYISSDGPKKGDEKDVEKVREYIKTIKGFKEVIIYESPKNMYGINIFLDNKKILEKHDRAIFLEDDIVANKYFLEYMNRALDIYKDNNRIFAVCAFLPDKIKVASNDDVFLSKRMSVYGIGLWKKSGFTNLILQNDLFNRKAYLELLKNTDYFFKVINRYPRVVFSLRQTLFDPTRRPAGDIFMRYILSKNDMFCIFPKKSLTMNIGYDGSGKCPINSDYNVNLSDFNPKVISNLKYNEEVDKPLQEFYKIKYNFFKLFISYMIDKFKYYTNCCEFKDIEYKDLIHVNN